MNPLRRNVEGWMGETLYQKLGEEPNIQLSWRFLRDVIGHQLFESEYVTVPYIESAIYFNQLFVFKKEPSIWSMLGIIPLTYKVIGNLDYLVNRDVSTWIPQFDFSTWDVVDGLKLHREYKLRVLSAGPRLEKSIELTIMEAHARSTQPPVPGTLTIHTNLLEDLKHVRKLYVITDVVFASFVKMTVRIGAQQQSITYNQDTPVGFKYRKYHLNREGLFCSEIPTILHYTEKDARWLKPLPQPVPTMSWWNSTRNKYKGGYGQKKPKNNLTIPTSEVTRRSGNTDAWLNEASALVRVDRPRANDVMLNARDDIHVNNNRVFEDDDRRRFVNQRRNNNQENANRRAHSLDQIL